MSDDMGAYITMSCMLLIVLCSCCYVLSHEHTMSMHACTDGDAATSTETVMYYYYSGVYMCVCVFDVWGQNPTYEAARDQN